MASYPIRQIIKTNGFPVNVPQDLPAVGDQCYWYDPISGARSVVIFGGLLSQNTTTVDMQAVAARAYLFKPDSAETFSAAVTGDRDPENTPRLIKGKWLPLNPVTGPAPESGIPEALSEREDPKDDGGVIFNPLPAPKPDGK